MNEVSSNDGGTPVAGTPSFLSGGGEMGARVRAFDWAGTHLGPPEGWPQSLKTAVSICLGSRHPIVLWWGRSALTQFYNSAYISFLGAGKHPWALGRSACESWSEIWPVIGPMIERVFETGGATWSEDLLLVLDRALPREEAYFTFSYSPIRNEDGVVGGIFCACYETTGRVIGERRLKTLRDLGPMRMVATAEDACQAAARTLEANPADVPFSLIYLLDNGNRTARVAATTHLGPGEAAFPCQIDLDGRPAAAARWPLRDALDTGQAIFMPELAETVGVIRGGRWPESIAAAMIVPVPGPMGPAGLLVSGISPRVPFDNDYRGFLDLVAARIGASITNARAHEEERKRAQALAELDRAKTTFFSNVSHEFRTPLTLMLGPLEEALAGSDLAPARREQLEVAHRSALRVLRLVNSLLDFSRIESGRAEACYQPTDLAALTAELASTFRSLCERAGLRLVVDCAALPEAVFVDREMWEKIVLNLLSNAFKFTFEGEIAVRVRREDGHAELSVRDTGVGIAEDQLPHIFERFHRVPAQRGRSFEGSGIGLALVQELVRLHGGELAVRSAENSGTSFLIRLRFGTAHLPGDRVVAERPRTSSGVEAGAYLREALSWVPNQPAAGPPSSPDEPPIPGAGVRGHILLADDNADMRAYVRRLLGARCEVETVGDGLAALEAIARRRPDLVLTDVMMPGLDGFGLLQRIRADPALSDLPVVMLSARAGEESRVEGLVAGADDYLVKPFSARELVARVESNLTLVRLRSAAANDLRLMELVHDIGSRCIRDGQDFEGRLDDILRGAMAISGAEIGSIRLVDRASGVLKLVAQKGLDGRFSDFFSAIEGACLAADDRGGRSARRIVIDDATQSKELRGTRALDLLRDAGIHAGQATPLISSTGRVLGAIATQFRAPHRTSGRELAFLDLLARQTADYLEREQEGEAEVRLAAIVESSDDAIVSKDLDGIIQSWNRGAERLFGYTAEEVVGRSITIIIPEERSGEEPEILARIRRGERIDHSETVRRRKDGELVDVSLTISPVLDRHGHIVGASKIARDITKRKRAEVIQSEQQALLEAIATGTPLEECLRGITEAVRHLQPLARAGILLADPSGSRIERFISSDIPASFGEGVCGLPINDAFIGSCGTAMFRGVPVTCPDIASDEKWSREWRDLCAMHGVAAIRSTPIFGSEGVAVGSLFICFATPRHPDGWDLRVVEIGAHVAAVAIQRQQARQAVVLRTAQFESLFNAAPVGLCLVDAGLRIREVNPVALPMFADVSDLIGRDFVDVMRAVWPTEVAAEIIGQFHNTLESGDAYAPAEPALRWRERDQAEYYEWQLDRLRLPDAQYGVVCYFRDVSIQVAAGKAIVQSEARLRHIIDSAQEYAIVSLDGGGRIRSWNAGAERLLGYDESEALGRFGKIFFTSEDVAAGIPEQEIAIAREAGRAASERWHVRKDGSRFWGSGVMLPLISGEPDMFLKIFRDGTERRQADRRQQLLINELNHRVKNTLATIQAIIRQSFRGDHTAKEAEAALEARLMMLARCHDLLTRAHWEGADLGQLAREALEPFAAAGGVPERFSIAGEPVRLTPQAAQSLAMGIHELATNAVRYGSLSVPGGKVSVRWTAEAREGEDIVRFIWEECHGPPVTAPGRKGFGSRLIERALASETGGSATLDYRKSGLRCEVRIPVRAPIAPG